MNNHTPDPIGSINKHIDNPVAAKYAAANAVAAGLLVGARVAPHPAAKAVLAVAGMSIGIYAQWNVRQYLIDGARWMVEEAQRPGWPQFNTIPAPKRHGDDDDNPGLTVVPA